MSIIANDQILLRMQITRTIFKYYDQPTVFINNQKFIVNSKSLPKFKKGKLKNIIRRKLANSTS
jgi:hypothetical protein